MNKIKQFLILLITLTAVVTPWIGASAQEAPVSAAAKQQIADSIAAGYEPWTELSLSGKLQSKMLPVTVNVKVYMVRDSLFVMSLSAFLMGEVARIEIDNEAAVIVNKLNDTYTALAVSDLENLCPGGLALMQNMLLGRISIVGKGVLTGSDASDVEIYDLDESLWALIPNQDFENAPYVYYYNVWKDSGLLQQFGVMTQDSGEATCSYSWDARQYALEMQAILRGRTVNATLRMDYPDAKPKPLARTDVKRYRQVSPHDIMKF